MVLSYVVNDIVSVSFILNQFSKVLSEYYLERNPVTGEIEMLTLLIPDEFEEEAEQIKELISMYATKK